MEWTPPRSSAILAAGAQNPQKDKGLGAVNNSSRVVFMSCNRQGMPNPFWDLIPQLNPMGVIWMGDNIYGDHTGTQKEVLHAVLRKLARRPLKTLRALMTRTENLFPPALPTTLSMAYNQTRYYASYQRILASPTLQFVIGTWDDHDYGVNDGDKTYIHRHEAKQLFLDFFNVSSTDRRRSSDYPGVYSVEHHFLPLPHSVNGQPSMLKVAFILLDTRFNKDPWSYAPETADFLGAQQWAWLETTLASSTADAHIIVSSIQVLSEQRMVTESWDKFPNARKRLLNLVFRTRAKNVIFLSGDVHFAEISSTICHPRQALKQRNSSAREPPLPANLSIPLWEITSSGLTHATRRIPYGFGLLLDVYLRWILPTNHVDSYRGFKQMWTGRNIGLLDTAWDPIQNVPALVFRILDSKGRTVLRRDLGLNLLHKTWATALSESDANDTHAGADSVHFDASAVEPAKWEALDWECSPIEGHVLPKRSEFAGQLTFLAGALIPLFLLTSTFACARGITKLIVWIWEKPKRLSTVSPHQQTKQCDETPEAFTKGKKQQAIKRRAQGL